MSSNRFVSKNDLIWLTNIATPYRVPVWNVLNSRLNFQLILLSNSEKNRNWDHSLLLKNFEYICLNLRPLYLFEDLPLYFNFLKPLKRIKKSDTKVIYIDGWESLAYSIVALYAVRKGIRVIFGYRSTKSSHRFNSKFVHKIRIWILSKADYIVTAGSSSTMEVKAMRIPQEKIITLFNPVDVNWFHSFAESHPRQQSLGHRFIYVGQLIDRKNITTIISAFAAIRKKNDTLIIAGDGPLIESLRKLTLTLGISESVDFVGNKNQDEIATLYSLNHTLILASTFEVWGLVVNEALASGMHVVVSDKCGVAEFVRNMKGSYICSDHKKSIQDSLQKSSQEWSGHIANPEILKFTPEKFAEGIIELINSFK